MSIISNLIRKSTKHEGPLNILSFFYDGRFDIELLKTGHHFYGVINTSYPWPGFNNAPYKNLHILNNLNEINNIDCDLILFNNRNSQQQFFGMCRNLHVPGLIIDHDISIHNKFFLNQIKQQSPLDCVSTSEPVQNQFGHQININYGIEQKAGEYEKDIDILISGNFSEQDLFIIHTIKQRFPSLQVVGHNPSLPYGFTVDNYENYKDLFKRSKIFLNLALQGNISYEILWCLQYKTAIVTCQTEAYSSILKDQENCIIINGLDNIINSVQNLAHNRNLFNKITNHNTDLSKFNQNNFLQQWKNLLEGYRYKVYTI